MAIVSMQLDPNAMTYTDDEIVGKVNSATAKIDADQLESGTTNKVFTGTEQTKLTGIEEGADANPTGEEIQTAILGLADADRRLIKTDPAVGEFFISSVQRDADGKLDVDYESVAKA